MSFYFYFLVIFVDLFIMIFKFFVTERCHKCTYLVFYQSRVTCVQRESDSSDLFKRYIVCKHWTF